MPERHLPERPMPKRPKPQSLHRHRIAVRLSWLARSAGLLLLALVAYSELHPVAIQQGDASRICLDSVEQYAAAVRTYREQKGWLPHSLDQLVPIYLPEHLECNGTDFGEQSITHFGLAARLRGLFGSTPAPCRPDYNLIQLPDGTQSFEIVCSRKHPGRCAFRGDTGAFVLADDLP